MSEQLQLRRGTAAQIAANTPVAGEVWVDTDHNRLVVGDGATLGGWAVAKMMEIGLDRRRGQSRSTPTWSPTPRSSSRCRPASPATASTRVTCLAPSLSLSAAQAARLHRGLGWRNRRLLAAGALGPDHAAPPGPPATPST